MIKKNKKKVEQSKVDILLSSQTLKQLLRDRIKSLNLTMTDVVQESKEHISGITKSNLSLYFNNKNPIRGFPTQKHILYLCIRYGIKISIIFTKEKYIEEKAINDVKKVFV